jgi:hypothetical protein
MLFRCAYDYLAGLNQIVFEINGGLDCLNDGVAGQPFGGLKRQDIE